MSGETARGAGAQSTASFALNPFIRIGTDGTVVIIVNKSEMGQGVYTALPMLVAEELEADWSKIRVEAAPVDPAYNHTQWGATQGTGGSSSVLSEWDRLRKAGAAARVMLVQAAADIWKVDSTSCRAKKGIVVHEPTDRRLSYGELAEKAARIKPSEEVLLKQAKDFEIIGKSVKRLDTPEKTSGRAVFGIDVKIPGMLTAVIARPPVFGGKLKSLNAEKARAVPGVKEVIEVDSGVAVVGDSFWSAKLGLPFITAFSRLTGNEPLYTRESLEIIAKGNRLIDNSKAKNELGLDPRPLSETIRDLIAWFHENNYLNK